MREFKGSTKVLNKVKKNSLWFQSSEKDERSPGWWYQGTHRLLCTCWLGKNEGRKEAKGSDMIKHQGLGSLSLLP